MAKVNNKIFMLLNLALIFSLLFVSLAEGNLFGISFGKGKSKVQCESVFGARKGDTCFAITQQFNMTTEVFNGLNPNLNCKKVFIGQWLCVAGTTK